jgi:predicted phage tail protein
MLRTIRIYGRLAKRLKRRKFEAEVSTAAEAIRFLLANFPEFEPELAKGHYKVSAGSYNLTLDELHHPTGSHEICIVPVIAGAGGEGLGIGQILLGVALIAVSLLVPAAAVGGMTALGLLGGALVLGGVATMLTPVPQAAIPGTSTSGVDTKTDPRKSYSFSGIQNTSRQGLPVPIVYGETLVGSVVISAGIDTEQVTA